MVSPHEARRVPPVGCAQKLEIIESVLALESTRADARDPRPGHAFVTWVERSFVGGGSRRRRAKARIRLTLLVAGAALVVLSSASGCGANSDSASESSTTDEQALSSHTSWSAHKTCWLYPGGCAVDVQFQYQFYNGYKTILAYAFNSSCEIYRVDLDGYGDIHGEDGPSHASYSPAVTHAVNRSLGLHSGRSQASLDLIIHSGSSQCEIGFGI